MKLTNEKSSNTTKLTLALAGLILVIYGFYSWEYEPQNRKVAELE